MTDRKVDISDNKEVIIEDESNAFRIMRCEDGGLEIIPLKGIISLYTPSSIHTVEVEDGVALQVKKRPRYPHPL